MGSLDGRVRRLEARRRAPQTFPQASETLEEARALNEEIEDLQRELQTQGIDPFKCLWGVDPDLPLEEHIAMLEEELRHDDD